MIARLETETGEVTTRRLEHANGEARAFYRTLPKPSLIGIEATSYTQWFERMVAEEGHELWFGDPAEIRARRVRRQKTDTRDAEHLLDWLLTNKFPRLWVPTPEERDLRQLLKHRDRLVRMQDVGEKSIALSGDEPGGVSKAKAVEPAGPRGVGEVELESAGQPAAEGIAGAAGQPEAAD